MRKRGLSRYEIHNRLAIPLADVDEILVEFQKHFYPDVEGALSHYAALDDQWLEDLIARWLPVATGPAVEIEKVARNGQSYVEIDHETPVKAAAVVLGAIKSRIQPLAAFRPESVKGKDGAGSTNVLLWLQNVMPGIQKVVEQTDCFTTGRFRVRYRPSNACLL
jgi:hypothetical protein